MVLTQFSVDIPEFRYTLAELDDAVFELVNLRSDLDGHYQLYFCVTGVARDRIVETLNSDPTPASVVELESSDHQTMIAVTCPPDSIGFQAYQTMIDVHGLLLESVAYDQRWHLQLYFPAGDIASTYFGRLEQLGIEPDFSSMQTEHGACAFSSTVDLTPQQREALIMATQRGYFSVPKQAALEHVAAELEISEQALSERLRRGTQTLIEQTIFVDTHLMATGGR